jgi:coproporphyrinogen III oxidase-like Fe-S oxidoreductase
MIKPDDGAPGFGVYLHWPFCAAKCPYCDFNSHVRFDPPDQKRYAAAFAQELAAMRQRTGARTVKSIFIGGGTPSLMDPSYRRRASRYRRQPLDGPGRHRNHPRSQSVER